MSNYATIDDLELYTQRSLKARDIWHRYAKDHDSITIALAQATDIIDRLNYIGKPATATNAFPRYGQSIVPMDVIKASMEIALALLDGVDPEMEFASLFHTQDSMETSRSTYSREESPMHTVVGVPSHTAMALLIPYLAEPGEIHISRV